MNKNTGPCITDTLNLVKVKGCYISIHTSINFEVDRTQSLFFNQPVLSRHTSQKQRLNLFVIFVLKNCLSVESSFFFASDFNIQSASAQSVAIVNKDEVHLRLQISSPVNQVHSPLGEKWDSENELLTSTKDEKVLNIQCKKCQFAITHKDR